MGLQEEIDGKRAEIRTDDYSMSIGEWISLYKNDELDIHPEFQRFFRWSEIQKTKLIESILLGIPIPPIYVSQTGDGKWDVIDGLQRLSTIFQFAGVLRREDDSYKKPLILDDTKYLPSLKDKVWDEEAAARINSEPQQLSLPLEGFSIPPEITPLTNAQQRYIKRSKIAVSIILRESDEISKYELFQRLNTGGSQLSDQEVRNAILIMTNRDMFQWMHELAQDNNFKDCVTEILTERAIQEQYDLEQVLRFLTLRKIDEEKLSTIGSDMSIFLTEEMINKAQSTDFDFEEEAMAFRQTFEILASLTSENSFKRYDPLKDQFTGRFRIPAFETIASSVGFHYEKLYSNRLKIEEIIKNLWQDEEFMHYSRGGMNASFRIPKLIPLGRKYFGEGV